MEEWLHDGDHARLAGGWLALGFGAVMLVRAYLAYRRHRDAQTLRMGLFVCLLGALLWLLILLPRFW